MKRTAMIPFAALAAAFFLLTACGNSNTEATMKPPVQTGTDTATQKAINDTAKKEEKKNGGKEENETKEKETKEKEKEEKESKKGDKD